MEGKMTKKLIISVIIILLITFSLSAMAGAAWWDKFGEPKYGGQLIIHRGGFEFSADPNMPFGADLTIYLESLFALNWALDRNKWSFPSAFIPEEYVGNLLAEGWEWTDAQTITVKIRKGIHWQDKPPVNGRELTAEDVKYSYDRMLGTGSGFSQPSPFWAGVLASIKEINVLDKYTVEFKLKTPGVNAIYQILEGKMFTNAVVVAREWVELGPPPAEAPKGGPPKGEPSKGGPSKGGPPTGEASPLQDWRNAVGTGPWMLTDVVQNSSMTFSRNPNYWGHDERYPNNQLPYLDTLKYVFIQDQATALAALRTGRTHMMTSDRAGALTRQQAESLAKTNPEIVQATWPGPGFSLEHRCDMKPFSDIRVRKALQMAVDRKLIADNYYAGTVDGKPCGVIAPYLKDYAFTYEEWPKSLKDEYSFNQERAKKLLAEAAADGTFKPNQLGGFDTNCLIDPGEDVTLLEVLKAMFLEIGVDMEIRTMDGASLRTFASQGKQDAMVASARMAMPFSPTEAVQVRVYTHRANYTHNNDDVFAEMVKSIDEATTMEEVKKRLKAADRYNLEQHWSVYVCPTIINIAWQPYIKGYSAEHTQNGCLGFIPARLWIDK